MPPKIQRLARTILKDPVDVKIAVSRPSDNIDQSAIVCHEAQKPGALKHLFKTYHSKRVIVFAASKLNVKDLTRELKRSGWKTGEMHSDLDQADREKVMLDFKSGRIDILVATDIVARGIDIDDISMVVNYDVPRESEDYVHRIGRTARAGTSGKAVTLVGGKDQQRFGQIEKFLGYEVRKEQLPADLGETPEYQPDRRSGRKSENSGHNRRKQPKDKTQKKSDNPTDEKTAGSSADKTENRSHQSGSRRFKRRRKSNIKNTAEAKD